MNKYLIVSLFYDMGGVHTSLKKAVNDLSCNRLNRTMVGGGSHRLRQSMCNCAWVLYVCVCAYACTCACVFNRVCFGAG